jgi:hypothetical protein
MNVTVKHQYTEDAGRVAAAVMPAAFKQGWASDPAVPPLIAGDLLSFGDEGDNVPVFEVLSRMVIWRSPDDVVIQLLIGLLPGADPKTGFVTKTA